jgi:hypothetical protein
MPQELKLEQAVVKLIVYPDNSSVANLKQVRARCAAKSNEVTARARSDTHVTF